MDFEKLSIEELREYGSDIAGTTAEITEKTDEQLRSAYDQLKQNAPEGMGFPVIKNMQGMFSAWLMTEKNLSVDEAATMQSTNEAFEGYKNEFIGFLNSECAIQGAKPQDPYSSNDYEVLQVSDGKASRLSDMLTKAYDKVSNYTLPQTDFTDPVQAGGVFTSLATIQNINSTATDYFANSRRSAYGDENHTLYQSGDGKRFSIQDKKVINTLHKQGEKQEEKFSDLDLDVVAPIATMQEYYSGILTQGPLNTAIRRSRMNQLSGKKLTKAGTEVSTVASGYTISLIEEAIRGENTVTDQEVADFLKGQNTDKIKELVDNNGKQKVKTASASSVNSLAYDEANNAKKATQANGDMEFVLQTEILAEKTQQEISKIAENPNLSFREADTLRTLGGEFQEIKTTLDAMRRETQMHFTSGKTISMQPLLARRQEIMDPTLFLTNPKLDTALRNEYDTIYINTIRERYKQLQEGIDNFKTNIMPEEKMPEDVKRVIRYTEKALNEDRKFLDALAEADQKDPSYFYKNTLFTAKRDYTNAHPEVKEENQRLKEAVDNLGPDKPLADLDLAVLGEKVTGPVVQQPENEIQEEPQNEIKAGPEKEEEEKILDIGELDEEAKNAIGAGQDEDELENQAQQEKQFEAEKEREREQMLRDQRLKERQERLQQERLAKEQEERQRTEKINQILKAQEKKQVEDLEQKGLEPVEPRKRSNSMKVTAPTLEAPEVAAPVIQAPRPKKLMTALDRLDAIKERVRTEQTLTADTLCEVLAIRQLAGAERNNPDKLRKSVLSDENVNRVKEELSKSQFIKDFAERGKYTPEQLRTMLLKGRGGAIEEEIKKAVGKEEKLPQESGLDRYMPTARERIEKIQKDIEKGKMDMVDGAREIFAIRNAVSAERGKAASLDKPLDEGARKLIEAHKAAFTRETMTELMGGFTPKKARSMILKGHGGDFCQKIRDFAWEKKDNEEREFSKEEMAVLRYNTYTGKNLALKGQIADMFPEGTKAQLKQNPDLQAAKLEEMKPLLAEILVTNQVEKKLEEASKKGSIDHHYVVQMQHYDYPHLRHGKEVDKVMKDKNFDLIAKKTMENLMAAPKKGIDRPAIDAALRGAVKAVKEAPQKSAKQKNEPQKKGMGF